MSLSQKQRVPLELDVRPSFAADILGDDAPAVRVTDELFDSAIAHGASDVHLEPANGSGRVRERVDGMLRDARSVPEPLFTQVLSRIKLLAGMDIADRRLPQDGRYTVERAGQLVDVRVASMPTIEGERLALRLLGMRTRIPSLEGLGMPSDIASQVRRLVGASSGFVIACGPTGSGKTTTLYAALSERNRRDAHVCSIEDPIEARIAGIAQVQVNARAGLDFSSALRAFLRQDPNVIMVGEMRDAATAKVAASAALCGQLVLTTLHGSDAMAAMERLMEFGIAPRTIATAVTGILAQRLVRQLCASCKEMQIAGAAARRWQVDPNAALSVARGCERCFGCGYRGRSAIFELLPMEEEVRNLVSGGAPLSSVRERAYGFGYRPMFFGGRRLLLSGETSVEELERVLPPSAEAL